MSYKKHAILLLVLCVVPLAKAQVVEEKVIIPIAIGGQVAAHGSVWYAETVAFNTSDSPISGRFASTCPVGCGNDGFFLPGESTQLYLTPTPIDRPGQVLFFTKGEASLLKMGSLVGEANSVNPGVWIPPVYESDLFTGVAHLVNVPALSSARLRLRIYSPDFASAGQFRIRVYSMFSENLLFDGPVTMVPGVWEFSPAYAEFSDFPDSEDLVRVQIDPITGGIRYWPLISVTSNATDAATIVLPSRP